MGNFRRTENRHDAEYRIMPSSAGRVQLIPLLNRSPIWGTPVFPLIMPSTCHNTQHQPMN